MKLKVFLGFLACFIIICAAGAVETRTYRQVKDVVVKENSGVSQSSSLGNMFEFTYDINRKEKTIIRTKMRRLDKPAADDDKTVYTIMQKQDLLGSEAGNGGRVLIAVRQDGGEILELGHRFAFTMRISPFSQVISGVYKRVYDKDDRHFFRKH